MNRAACSYTVTSIPTRLNAAAAARPPMPAPMIAMDRGLAIDSHHEMAKLLGQRRRIDIHHLIAVLGQLTDGLPPRLAASARDNHACHFRFPRPYCCHQVAVILSFR